MIKYVKNTTLSDKMYAGCTVSASSYREIPVWDHAVWSSDANLIADLTSGDARIAYSTDGSSDIIGNAAILALNSAGALDTSYLSSTSTASTSSSSFSLVGGMTITPPSGDYLVFFGAKANTSGVNAQSEYGIFIDGVIVAETKRELSCTLSLLGIITISLNTIGVEARTSSKVTVNGSQSIEIKFRSVNGVSVSFGEKSLTIVRVS